MGETKDNHVLCHNQDLTVHGCDMEEDCLELGSRPKGREEKGM